MIDIHNHGLFGVDDGAASKEEAVSMLKDAAEQGIRAIVLTPHYRHGMFKYPKELVDEYFDELKAEAASVGIKLYLGCEYHVNSKILEYLQQGRCHAMAGGRYVLTEYSGETPYTYIEEWTRKLLRNGYIPIIAHAERYECIFRQPKRIDDLIRFGAMIQMNADSVIGKVGFRMKYFCLKVLKDCYESIIIASDAHDLKVRMNRLGKSYDYISRKLGSNVAEIVLERNPGRILHE